MSEQKLSEKLLAQEEAYENMNKIRSNMKRLHKNSNKQHNIWKLKSKFYPKVKPSVPTAKQNAAGKLITNSGQLKEVYLKNFVHRLRPRPIIPGLEQYKHEIES